MITKDQVIEVQEKWGNGVVKIGTLKEKRTECEAFASSFLDERYAHLHRQLFCSSQLSVK